MIETNLKGNTPDIAEENIQKLKQIFPDVFTDDKVDFEKLQQVLGDYAEDSNERYNFTWNGKGRALRLSQTPSLGTLRPCKEESKNWDTTENLYIEGDNLEVLKLLRQNYYGAIKMIYIDPPYNTGNDFVYNDNFAMSGKESDIADGTRDDEGTPLQKNQQSSNRFHANWLNMMYPRLKVAKDLLTDDGVIFISIDDNEQDNLKKICNEIFGSDNFVGCISRATGTTTGQDANKIGSSLDYCMVYSKSSLFSLNGLDMDEKDIKRFYEEDSRGKYSTLQLRKTGTADTREARPNMFYPVVAPDGSDVFPFGPTNYLSRWRVGRETYDQLLKDDMIVWKESEQESIIVDGYKKSKWTPYVKYYLEGRTKQVSNLFQDIEGNKKASIVLKDLLGSKGIFDNPKPVEFLKILTQISTTRDEYILDFFSGSGTTAHAIMEYNSKKETNHKFIMVQLPETTDENSEAYKAGYMNICEIGKERIRRAGEKIKEENKDKEKIANLDIGFKVLKLDTSNIRKWQTDYDNLEQSILDYVDNYVDGRTDMDVVYEIMLKYGLDLTYPVDEFTIAEKKVYSIGFGMLMICLDNEITAEVTKGILEKVKELAPESTRVVFKDDGFKNGFKTDRNKVI